MDYDLHPVATEADWQALHAIRRATLFAPGRHPGIVYDADNPDDRASDHIPLLLLGDGVPLGVARLDLRGDAAVVRLVAIVPEQQRLGHGRVLDALLADRARQHGIATLLVNAAPDAVGFYARCGWQREAWDPGELTGIAADCVQMRKPL